MISLFGFSVIPFLFFPDSDRNLITVDINLPLGTRIERTTTLVEEIEAYIQTHLQVNEARAQGVIDWSSYIGEGPESYDMGYSADEANASYAHLLINTSSADHNNAVIEDLDRYCFEQFPDADIKVSSLGAGGSGVPIEVKVTGDDPDILARIAESIKLKLSFDQRYEKRQRRLGSQE